MVLAFFCAEVFGVRPGLLGNVPGLLRVEPEAPGAGRDHQHQPLTLRGHRLDQAVLAVRTDLRHGMPAFAGFVAAGFDVAHRFAEQHLGFPGRWQQIPLFVEVALSHRPVPPAPPTHSLTHRARPAPSPW